MSATSRAAWFQGAGSPFLLRDVALAKLAPGEVRVRISGCTLCGSDLHTWSGRRGGPTPVVLGHEMIGTVECWGTSGSVSTPPLDFRGTPLRPGDRVTWAIVAPCGGCFYCQRGLPQKCERGLKYGHASVSCTQSGLTGGLAEYCVLAPRTAIFRIPDTLSDAVACPANCATATVQAALASVGGIQGRRTVVLGLGMLGLTACAMLHAQGAERVLACDLDPARRDLAKEFGADTLCAPEALRTTCRDTSSGYGYDVAFDFTGVPELCAAALESLRMGGELVLVGAVFPVPAMSLLPEQVVRRQLTIRGIHNYAPVHLGGALDFLAGAEAYPFASLCSSWFPLEEVDQAFATAHADRPIRLGVRP